MYLQRLPQQCMGLTPRQGVRPQRGAEVAARRADHARSLLHAVNCRFELRGCNFQRADPGHLRCRGVGRLVAALDNGLSRAPGC